MPSVEGADFEQLDRFKCPVCSAPKRRFSSYGGAAAGKGVNDMKNRQERKAKLQGGGGGGKEAGNRRASGEGVDSGTPGSWSPPSWGLLLLLGRCTRC